jgi:hypothetical protein
MPLVLAGTAGGRRPVRPADAGSASGCAVPPGCGPSKKIRRNQYDADFAGRTVAYYGCNGEEYIESYPSVDVKQQAPC